MYKILNIGAGEIDRFITVENDNANKFKVFDYSASCTMDISETFNIELGKKYKMKLEFYGKVVEPENHDEFTNIIQFTLLEKEFVGKHELYLVKTNLGEFYIPVDAHTKTIEASIIKMGFYGYSRIDLVQLDGIIHPEYK